MKKLLFVILLSVSVNLQAQEWAPVGATWYYNYNVATGLFGQLTSTAYSVFESVGDTLVEGINCRKIEKSKNYSWGNRPMIECTYYSNDSVFFYDDNFDEFQLLYDFNASAGDFWFYRFPGYSFSGDIDSIKTVVDSTDFVTINSVSLKRLFVHYEGIGFEEDWMFDNNDFYKNSQIIEYIGDTKNLINTYVMDEQLLHAKHPAGLRCYEDNFIGHYETGVVDSCNYVNVLALDENETENFTVYPNPATDYLFFDQPFDHYEIYTPAGRLVVSGDAKNSKSVSVHDLSPGLYLLSIKTGDNLRLTRFIKE